MQDKWIKSRKAQIVIGAVLVACAAFFFLRGAKSGAAEEARDVLLDLKEGRGAGVYRLATPEERGHLSREQWEQVYTLLIKPRLDQFPTEGKLEADASGDSGSLGNAWTTFKAKNGKTMLNGITIWMTEQGATAPMATTCLTLAWRLEWFGQHGSDFRNHGLARAYLDGLRKDRATLQSLGIKGFYLSPQEGFQTLDQLDERWATRIAKSDRGGA